MIECECPRGAQKRGLEEMAGRDEVKGNIQLIMKPNYELYVLRIHIIIWSYRCGSDQCASFRVLYCERRQRGGPFCKIHES